MVLTMKECFLQISEMCSLLGGISHQAIYKIIEKNSLESIMLSSRRKVLPPESVRQILISKDFKYPKRKILSFDMIKGGVGKTTLSSTFALRASFYGCRTLLIDFDLQGNLTRSFISNGSKENKIWINILKDGTPIQDTVIKISENLHIIPSNLNNSRLDIEMQQASINIKDHVKDIIQPIIDNYDLIVIDCPPAINKVSAAAICASSNVVIPLNPDPFAMDGLQMTLNEINRIKMNFKMNSPDYLVIWNKYDARKRLGAIYMHDLGKDIPVKNIIPVVIRTDASYENAVADASSIFGLPRSSNAKEDIDQMTRELLGISKWQETL